MKICQSTKRNEPSTISGESITVTIVYSSFNKDEIDKLEKELPKELLIMDDKKGGRCYNDDGRAGKRDSI